ADDLLEHRRPGDLFAKSEVLLADEVLRLLPFVDVGAGRVPANHAAPLVAQRIVADEEPTVDAVAPPQPCLEPERNARGEPLLPLVLQAFHLIRMEDRLAKSEGAQVVESDAGVVGEYAIRV